MLTLEEAERVLAQPDVTDTVGLRDRAILETLYSTGMRRTEAALLKQWDVDFDAGTILIRCGKGGKVRTVPVGERALAWLAKYLSDARPLLVVEPDDGALFVGDHGQAAEPGLVGDYVKRHLETAGIKKRGCCHLFRHTAATLMLQNGADIRFIQQFLGHSCLGTTEIYTHVSIRQLKEVHTATHPGAKLDPREAPDHFDDQPIAPEDPTETAAEVPTNPLL